MISGEKILVTGASGLVGLQLARYLARENEVWGLARYSRAVDRGLNAFAESYSAIHAHRHGNKDR